MEDNNRKLYLFDGTNNRDKASVKKTDIQIFIEGTDELVFRGSNKVILAGSAFTASKHFDIVPPVKTPSYNEALALDNTVTTAPENLTKVILFAVGTDGCGVENSQIYPVNYSKWLAPEALVPFRYQLDNDDLAPLLRETYFGRKVVGNRIAYYFKAFDTAPQFIQQYVDGTPIDENIYTSSNPNEVESFVELKLKVTKEDCRDYFIATTGINDARINTITLLEAWSKVIDGATYYQDIRPLTKLNIPNEPLIDLTKGLDIIYHIYY